ncbi:MAG: YdcF family protein [Holosporales bacterium]|jgi:uncharacterized SAM-binding protein YcdF (DUF218 family)|nr:YdcF family protein [Thalassospira sp.]
MLWRVSLILFIVLCGGFVRFVDAIPRPIEGELPQGDAIVVLTGGTARLEAAGKLFRAGSAPEIFISGVHNDVKPRELAKLMGLDEAMTDCCLTIGFAAQTTRGNAAEISDWAARRTVRKIVFVTNQAHMLRALSELRRAVTKIEIIPYPVVNPEVNPEYVWQRPGVLLSLLMEYVKFLFAGAHRLLHLELNY